MSDRNPESVEREVDVNYRNREPQANSRNQNRRDRRGPQTHDKERYSYQAVDRAPLGELFERLGIDVWARPLFSLIVPFILGHILAPRECYVIDRLSVSHRGCFQSMLPRWVST